MYSTKTATQNTQEFNSSYMPVGINENITLKEVSVNVSPQGRNYLEVIFQNSDGQTASMTEWKNEKNMWIKTDEELQSRDNQQFGRILQIIDAINGGHSDFEATSFLEMITWAKNEMTKNLGPTPLRLKVIYDKNGYTQVSKNGVFIEPMSTTESNIKLWKKDLLERPVVADKEPAMDPLTLPGTPEVDSVNTTSADDLPF